MLWVVVAVLLAEPLVASLDGVCVALFSPPLMSPVVLLTGTLALTAFCLASACETAVWSVSDH